MRPYHAPSGPPVPNHYTRPQGQARPQGRDLDTICCELFLDKFGFLGHGAPWCPFLHPDNIRDREIKQRVQQFKITHAIKQDPVPDKLKHAIRLQPPPSSRLPRSSVKFAVMDNDISEDGDDVEALMLR